MIIMEVENMSRKMSNNNISKEKDDDEVPLPGFRFHPTDEELVGFYLRRKVEKRPISIELIKQADIYKYDPWDLPKSSINAGDKEWYFFCKRGRKYKNSIRPNRVTGSGFWKATGIDRPIYSSSGEGRNCIGLKKSLVYYRGFAGKGTKTEWMMHEFRLPPKTIADQEAEVWTLCRILKRDVSYKKFLPDWRQVGAKKINNNNNNAINMPVVIDHPSSETCSVESCDQNGKSNYISFNKDENKPHNNNSGHVEITANQQFLGHFGLSQAPSAASSLPSYIYGDIYNEMLRHGDWEDLQSIVGFSAATANINSPFYF